MENFKQIEKSDVWAHLQSGKKVCAVVLKSRNFNTCIFDLRVNWSVPEINKILRDDEKNVIFYEEIEV